MIKLLCFLSLLTCLTAGDSIHTITLKDNITESSAGEWHRPNLKIASTRAVKADLRLLLLTAEGDQWKVEGIQKLDNLELPKGDWRMVGAFTVGKLSHPTWMVILKIGDRWIVKCSRSSASKKAEKLFDAIAGDVL